ncbi:MAG TPA: hypothetical protein VNT29_00525 [Candidatus Limnocylindrales bacterium]|nr:hypothetical protein [Candidatus Limnocylindrales bacterium]
MRTWEDETSQFDPKGTWKPGSEYHSRTYRMWIPNRIKKTDQDAIDDYLMDHQEPGPHWVAAVKRDDAPAKPGPMGWPIMGWPKVRR